MESRATFTGNVMTITGASSGIGREVARQLAEQGAWLALAARDADRQGQAAAECRQRGGHALVVKTDVGVEGDCRNLIERAAVMPPANMR
jgi:NADP-dependent 3-hydroxy acid dehydrogenase YdfG